MSEQFQPTEEQIEKVLNSYPPRQIAIAYLRASHRARQANHAFDLAMNLNDFTLSAVTGDVAGAKEAVNRAKRSNRAHAQHNTEGAPE